MQLLKFAARGVLIAVLAILAKMWFETTAWGVELEQATIRVLSRELGPDGSETLPVVVVDISSATGAFEGQGDQRHTSRKFLSQLLTEISRAYPTTIGIDIDFSPPDGLPLSASDRTFLELCRELSTKGVQPNPVPVPVRLGVGRGSAGSESDWLGAPAFKEMAATILLDGRNVELTPLELNRGQHRSADPIRSMAAALADAHCSKLAPHAEPRGCTRLSASERYGLEAFFTRVIGEREPLALTEFRVNYRALDALEQSVISVSGPTLTAYEASRMRNRIVIVGGMGDEFSDIFGISMDGGRQVRGLMVHASAALTLLEGPIRHWTHTMRILIDLTASIAILGVVLVVGVVIAGRQQRFAEHQFALVVSRIVAVVVVLVGTTVLIRSRILWSDSLILAASLAYHEQAGQLLSGGLALARRIGRSAFDRYVQKD